MFFRMGYVFNWQMSERFWNLAHAKDATQFTIQDLRNVVEVVAEGAMTEQRFQDLQDGWFETSYIRPADKERYLQVVRNSSIETHWKVLLENALDVLEAAAARSTSLDDRLGLIASNVYLVQDFLRAQKAKLLDMTFLTHFAKAANLPDVPNIVFAQGLSFGLSRVADVALCVFYTVSAKTGLEYVSLDDEAEHELLVEYLRLHGGDVAEWDCVPNSIFLSTEFHRKVAQFLEGKQVPDRVAVKPRPVFAFGKVPVGLGETAAPLTPELAGVIVLDEDLFAEVQKFGLVDVLEHLSATFRVILDANLVHSRETLSVVPIEHATDLYAVVEYARVAERGSLGEGASPFRIGVVYALERQSPGALSLSDFVTAHASAFHALLKDAPADEAGLPAFGEKLRAMANSVAGLAD
ncbi:MAG: hypothetical protein Kow0069_26390 [Promethearchaeota archaeon]